MSNYSSLKATINANIKANGNQEITGPVMNSVLNAMVDSLGTGYQYKGKAVPSTNPGTPDSKVYYLASEPGTYTNFNGIVVSEGEVAILKWDTAWSKEVTGAATAAQLTQLGQETVKKDNADEIGLKDASDKLFIADSNGNAILGIDEDGLKTTSIDAGHLNGSNIKIYNDKLYVTDPDGYIVCMVDKNGVHTTKVNSKDVLKNSWGGKVMATYGDSITAVNNGDFEYPFNPTEYNWGLEVAKFFSMGKEYGRGIGGTSFRYRDHGGPVAWVDTITGQYVGRNDSYNYDNYTGEIPAGCTKVRGDGSSWLRLSSMFPSTIRGTIDVILIMFHNDFNYDMDTDVEWIPNDATDPEWAASTQYTALGGDYNIGTVKGGIASVVMKLQALMPQATIILMTPIGGVYTSSGVNTGNFNNTETAKMKKLADCVMDVAQRMSTPCINVYGNCGINTLNRSIYISDTIHPYTVAGRKKIGRAVSSGLISQVAL